MITLQATDSHSRLPTLIQGHWFVDTTIPTVRLGRSEFLDDLGPSEREKMPAMRPYEVAVRLSSREPIMALCFHRACRDFVDESFFTKEAGVLTDNQS